MRGGCRLALALAWLCLALVVPAAGEEAALPDLWDRPAQAYLLAVDGQAAFARSPDRRLAPASLTKLMTALVLRETAWAPETELAVSARAAAMTGSRLGLRRGDRLGRREAFTAMLVASANDACLALAEDAAGSAEEFVRRMNARAAALGLTDTTFENPCGFDHPTHLSTARDLLRLAQIALADGEIAAVVAKERARVVLADGRSFAIVNGNALLGRLEGAAGVKTGFTAGAGKCLIALARREGREVMLVLLGAPDRWWTAARMIEDTFRMIERAKR